MNDYARDMMRGRSGRGDYRMSDRNRGMDSRGDYRGDYDMNNRDYGDDYGYDRRDYRDYGDYGHDMAMDRERDYTHGDYARRRSSRTGRFMRDRGMHPSSDYRMDYAMNEKRLSKSDIDDWKKSIKNEDGTKGGHFNKEQAEQIAPSVGINIERLGKEEFVMAMNMMYADYCETAKKFGVNRPEFYACLAKDFLDDRDFDGEGKEKLMLYYKCIVEKDEN